MKSRMFVSFLVLCSVLMAFGVGVSSAATYVPSTHIPGFVRNWYGLSKLPFNGSGQTIAIVGAGDYEKAAADLEVHIASYKQAPMNGLPGTQPCTIAAGPYPCFERVKAPASGIDPGPLYWSGGTAYHLEAASDIQWAHVAAPGANILFVDAATPQPEDLLTAVDVAVAAGASVVSMSFGWEQSSADLARDAHFMNKPGVVFVAGSGDRDYKGKVLYPAASPYVLAVGGTTLKMDAVTAQWSETAWGRFIDSARTTSVGSTGGLSMFDGQPAYQTGFQSAGKRAVPDVAYAADWTSYPTYVNGSYINTAGTSLGAPQWAGIVAVANQARSQIGKASLTGVDPFYAAAAPSVYASNYRDITAGFGACMLTWCAAGTGYDMATGLGSPRAENLVPFLAGL